MVSRVTATAVLFGLLSAVMCPASVTAGGQTVTLRSGALTLTLARGDAQPAVGGLQVTEGVAATPVAWGAATAWEVTATAATCRREDPAGLECVQQCRTGEALRINLAFTNHGAKQRLLEVSYAVPLAGTGLTWWDGIVTAPPRPAAFVGLSSTLRFPLSAVYGGGAGVAVGVDPHRLLSTFATGAVPSATGLQAVFATRLVVDPGQTVTLPLYALGFTPRYGFRDAVQRTYGLFPDMFSMTRGIRPLIVGGGGYLFSSAEARHLQWEEARRYGMGWEWAYCPAQIPGDWYADERFYDPDRGYAGRRDSHVNVAKGSLEDYRRDMRERFRNGWPATVLGFYMLPHAADEVVLKAFPDAVITDAQGNQAGAMKGWIKRDSTTHMTYPWGNAYGQEVVREIRQIAQDFQPGAIAFDEAYVADQQYGAGIAGDPARAWNEQGVYATTQVALAHLGDAIHATRVREYTLATIFNKPHTYNTATRADVAMHEYPPFINPDTYAYMRLLAGHKPTSWWHGATLEDVIRWQELSPDQIREAAVGMTDFMRLSCLRFGAFPMNMDAIGRKQLIQMMPVLTEMLRAGPEGPTGWQPVPAATAAPELWLSRYGAGGRSFLVAGNPTTKPVTGALRVDTGYLGAGHFLFSDYAGRPLEVRSAGGHAELDLGTLDAHADRIARALLQVETAAATTVSGSAQCTPEPLATGIVQAQFTLDKPGPGRLTINLPDGATPQALTLNGKPVKPALAGAAVRYAGPLARRNDLRLTYRPSVAVTAPEAALLAFPFVGAGEATAKIETPAQPAEQDSFTARRIASYFEWYYRRQSDLVSPPWDLVKVGRVVKLPVCAAGQGQPGPVVALVAKPEAAVNLSPDGQRLEISGPTPDARETAMLRLLSLLDHKYECYGGMPSTPALIKADLAGKPLL